ncbi:MAG: hypothetical protein Kow0020_06630 [Wenzhouxiangellaceae bacterium]
MDLLNPYFSRWGPVPGRGRRTLGLVAAGLLVAVLCSGSALAADKDSTVKGPGAPVDLNRIILSSDVNAFIPYSLGGIFLTFDEQAVDLDVAAGNGGGFAFAFFGPTPGVPIDLSGYHHDPQWFVVDRAMVIGGVLVRPNDVFRVVGGVPQFVVRGSDIGMDDHLRIDAVSMDPVSGDPVFSIDTVGRIGGIEYVPTDLLRWNGTDVLVYWDGLSLFQDFPGTNIDALHILDANRILVSVDNAGLLPLGGSTLRVLNSDILMLDPVNDDFLFAYTMNPLHPSWDGADVDALWAEEQIQGGEVRLLSAYHEVQESAGTLTIQLERTGGNEGAVSIQVDAIGATATEGSDFSGDQTLTNLWADGEDGVRSFSINIVNDSSQEPHEQFSVQISVSDGAATLGSPSQAQIVILDDDGQNLFSDGFES